MVRRIIILIFLLMFTINPQAYAKNFYSNHEKDLETWKESITNCVKEEERDGFWVDIAIDESGSMDSEDRKEKL